MLDKFPAISKGLTVVDKKRRCYYCKQYLPIGSVGLDRPIQYRQTSITCQDCLLNNIPQCVKEFIDNNKEVAKQVIESAQKKQELENERKEANKLYRGLRQSIMKDLRADGIECTSAQNGRAVNKRYRIDIELKTDPLYVVSVIIPTNGDNIAYEIWRFSKTLDRLVKIEPQPHYKPPAMSHSGGPGHGAVYKPKAVYKPYAKEVSSSQYPALDISLHTPYPNLLSTIKEWIAATEKKINEIH